MAQPQSFDALPLPRKDFSLGVSSYRVYKDDANYVTVKAQTALEALQASGMPAAHKIEKDSLDLNKVVQPQAWASIKATESEAAKPAAATAPTTEEAKPLSSDDVNQLLKN